MIKFYDNIEAERDRIEALIKKFGRTSDHNLDWWTCVIISSEGAPVFVEFPDGSGLLAHRYPNEWRIWSDPLSAEADMATRIGEFSQEVFRDDKIKELWCDDVADNIYPELKKISHLKLNEIFYSLLWPVMNMADYDPALPGGHFKDMRNARNKFYREHKIEIKDASQIDKKELHRIVDDWKRSCSEEDPQYIYDLKYHLIIDKEFGGFKTARVMIADGRPIGFNAGYEVPNNPDRFGGIIGLHDYSLKNDLGTVLWLEDLEWIKNAGYKELDMQGSEDDGGLKLKIKFGGKVERKTDTFLISR